MNKIFFTAILTFATCAHAQEAPIETQAVRCSALSYIHTSIASPPEFSKSMQAIGELYSGIYSDLRKNRTGSSMSSAQFRARRDTVEVEFRNSWETKPEVVIEEAALCNSWRAEFAPKIAALSAEERRNVSATSIIGDVPPSPKAGEVEKWRPITTQAFEEWKKLGALTSGEIDAMIQKNLEEPALDE